MGEQPRPFKQKKHFRAICLFQRQAQFGGFQSFGEIAGVSSCGEEGNLDAMTHSNFSDQLCLTDSGHCCGVLRHACRSSGDQVPSHVEIATRTELEINLPMNNQ